MSVISSPGGSEKAKVPWRTLTPTVLIPNFLNAIGQGAVMPAIPITALHLGGSLATAAVVMAMLTVGQMMANLPAGWLVNKVGERATMQASTIATALGACGAWLADSTLVLGASVFVMGSGVAVFTMARHAWITAAVDPAVRGRSLSLVAGFNRLGTLIGPFIAAAAFALTGDVSSAFITVMASSLVLMILLWRTHFPVADDPDQAEDPPRVLSTLWENRAVLVNLGFTVAIIGMMRTSRRILVPLIGVVVGLDSVQVALVVGLASSVDFAFFYLGGVITDRMGRLWVAVPPLWIFGIAHFAFAIVPSLPGATAWFIGLTVLMAAGNSIGSGVVATIGSDMAAGSNPATFLASWRLTTDAGPAVAPLIIGGLIAGVSLPFAAVGMGVLSLYGAAALPRLLGRYLPEQQQVAPETVAASRTG